jgi:hypothetical protein
VSERIHIQVKPAENTPFVPTRFGFLQRKCACGGTSSVNGECAECRQKRLLGSQRGPDVRSSESSEAPAVVQEVLASTGQPLEAATRAVMEPRFGYDFSQVRVHADAKAAQSAWAVSALAYTVGRDIVFAEGRYEPGTEQGRKLLAHELTHTVQQSRFASTNVSPQDPITIEPAHTALERAAEESAASLAMSPGVPTLHSGTALQRAPDDPGESEIQSYVFAGDKKLSTDKDFALRSGVEIAARVRKSGKLSKDVRLELNGMLAFFQGEAKDVYIREIKPALVEVKAGGEQKATSKTVFHPGVMHNHQPSGRWAEVQANPNSPFPISTVCKHSDPKEVMQAASFGALKGKWTAIDHLKWFFNGGGADLVEDSNLDLMLRTDSKVQAKIRGKIPAGQSSGVFTDYVTITQDNYDDEDLQYSFGEIDRLDFAVDFDAGTLHAWFQDRYEWHPVYPFYTKFSDDYVRDTNCVHAAAVELKSGTARDYWMKGEMTIPLTTIRSAAPRRDNTWQDPQDDYPAVLKYGY